MMRFSAPKSVAALLVIPLFICNLACRSGPDFAKRIHVGTENIYIRCEGVRHGPAVVFESGNGGTADDWQLVQPAIAQRTQACSYTRPDVGRGGSRNGYVIPTEDETVRQLHKLLANAGVPPPYVIAGHSYGGMLARQYSTDYPSEVVGMVFVDSAHEESIWRFRAIAPNAIHGISESDLLRQGFLPPGQTLNWHDDVPLIVIEHGQRVADTGDAYKNAAIEKEMDALDLDLVHRSRYGRLVWAKHSHHNVPFEDPEVVIRAIDDVLDEVTREGTGDK